MYTPALIPPISMLSLIQGDRYHLALAHLALPNQRDSEFYRRFFRQESELGNFVILDNGAHELGKGLDPIRLADIALDIRASEVVLPDRLFWGEDTVDHSLDAISRLRGVLPSETKYMGVPQGRTLFEWFSCMERLIDLGATSIGISKDYEIWEGGLMFLVALVPAGIEVHLLGFGRQPEKLFTASNEKYRSKIRGTDSAKPIIFAMAGLRYDQDIARWPTYCKRPGNYFDRIFNPRDVQLYKDLVHNIGMYYRHYRPDDGINPEEVVQRLPWDISLYVEDKTVVDPT